VGLLFFFHHSSGLLGMWFGFSGVLASSHSAFGAVTPPMQALIDGKVLCVHGGLSPDIRTLDQVSGGAVWCQLHGLEQHAWQQRAAAH